MQEKFKKLSRGWVIGLLSIIPLSQTLAATSAELSAQAQSVRQSLLGITRSTLDAHCAGACAGFKIEPRFSSPAKAAVSTGDLGFESVTAISPETLEVPELRSVDVTVLVQSQVKSEERETLRQILTAAVGNESGVATTVKFKDLAASTPAQTFQARSHPTLTEDIESIPPRKAAAIDWVQVTAWPIVLSIAILAACFALARTLRHRMEMQKAMLTTVGPSGPTSAQDPTSREVSAEVQKLLEKRGADWVEWIERSTRTGDDESIQSIVNLISATDLTSKLNESGLTLSVRSLAGLAKREAKSLTPPQQTEALERLQRGLEQAHWHRQWKDAHPLADLNDWSDADLRELYGQLAAHEPATLLVEVLRSLDERRWAMLLESVDLAQRLEIGKGLASGDHHSIHPDQMREALQRAQAVLAKRVSSSQGDWTLYFSTSELERIRQITPVGLTRYLGSSWLERADSLSDQSLLEVAMGMDPPSLGAILSDWQAEAPALRSRLLLLLPAPLKARLQTQLPAGNAINEFGSIESRLRAARAEWGKSMRAHLLRSNPEGADRMGHV